MKAIVQDAKKKFPLVTDKVAEEINTLLGATLGSKEMGNTEINKIVDRLINFQLEQDVKAEEEL